LLRRRIVRRAIAEQLAEEPRISKRRLAPGAQLPGEDGTDVRRHEDLEAPLPGHPFPHLREQHPGERVEELGSCGPVLH
jgi:hypothetical protein